MSARRALIKGITGQDGSYLAEFLLGKGYTVVGVVRRTSHDSYERIGHLLDRVTIVPADLLDQHSLTQVIQEYRPDEVYNLAAQSFVPASWSQPVLTGEFTALGVTRILEAIRLAHPKARFYQASSSEQFGKVLSHIGSFTNIRGGWAYPGLVRKTKDRPKAIKVYLQDGKDDLNNLHGNWPLGNRDLAAALQFAGYHYKLVMTEGGHSGKYGGEAFPEALRWLWSKDSEPSNMPVVETKPEWQPHPDAVAKDDVPHGTVEQMPPWESVLSPADIAKVAAFIMSRHEKPVAPLTSSLPAR